MNITMTANRRNYLKGHVRHKRRMAEKFKAKEVIKYSHFQTKCDRLERCLRKKGSGKALKIKGEVLPMPLVSNEHWVKNIGRQSNKREGFKHYMLVTIKEEE